MSQLKYMFITIIETFFRMMPFPCRTGLIKIGNPDRNSPVLVTCNFHLTVERVRRALKSMDCYLLVANSHGINVWCAATGGHFTSHSVISVLKTSGIEKLVDHRKVILPQLAATGVEGKIVTEKTGWHILWGPVYAHDIPQFIENRNKKTPEMRQVKFPFWQRLEMAIAWGFPISLIAGLVIYFVWRSALLPLVAVIWGLSFLIFLFFPVYQRLLSTGDKKVGLVFFDFGKGGIQIIIWGFFLIGLAVVTVLNHNFSWGLFIRWGIASLVIILLLSMDLSGSTPIIKSGLHPDRMFKITLNANKCKGAAFCELVCPKNCYQVDRGRHLATIPRKDQCVQCGACIVQCPYDALYFENSKGEVLSPDHIRKYKLNLIGTRKTT
jgi:NAD-dependent dihydropyrimidine dehydrogenase PreA subunit